MTKEKRKFLFRYEVSGSAAKVETFGFLHNGIQVTPRMIGIDVKKGPAIVTFVFGDGSKSDEVQLAHGHQRLEVPLAARIVEIKPQEEGRLIDFVIQFYD